MSKTKIYDTIIESWEKLVDSGQIKFSGGNGTITLTPEEAAVIMKALKTGRRLIPSHGSLSEDRINENQHAQTLLGGRG